MKHKSIAKSPRGIVLGLLNKFSRDVKSGKVYTATELSILFSEYLNVLKKQEEKYIIQLKLVSWKGKDQIDITKDFKNDFQVIEHRKDKLTGEVDEVTHEIPAINVNNIKNFILTWKVGESHKCYDFATYLKFDTWKDLWKERKVYFSKYYWPVKVLELLKIIEYGSRGKVTRLK